MNITVKRNDLINFIKKDMVLVIASILAILSCFLAKPKIEYIDFKVLALLFNLMIIVAAFKKLNVFDNIATSILSKCTSYLALSMTLVFITFFSAMIITNDVALLTFVPLTLIICNKADINALKLIIFETLAANLGSALTPMGNPQNLYLYSYFNINTMEFFKITMPMILISIIFLIGIQLKEKNHSLKVDLHKVEIKDTRKVLVYSVLFIIILMSVFHILDYKIAFILTLITVFVLDKKLFVEVDYSLLVTFIAFFIFIGNISSLDSIKTFMTSILSTKESTFFTSIAASQVISNVPATMLMTPFISNYKELLLGVNIGGLGTLIASLASIISYKQYVEESPENNSKYIKVFTVYNLLGLIILIPLCYLLLVH